MPYIRNPLANKLVSVWTTQQGQPTSDTAIISAHGETAYMYGPFAKGNYKLRYYGPHFSNLADPGLVKFWKGKVAISEEVSSDFHDYLLTKYQGAGNNKAGETYDLIEKLPVEPNRPDIITVSEDKSFQGELLGKWEIKLSSLIELIFNEGYHYKIIGCAFCRGRNWPFIKDPVHTPEIIPKNPKPIIFVPRD